MPTKDTAAVDKENTPLEPVLAKRGRGRPRKNDASAAAVNPDELSPVTEASPATDEVVAPGAGGKLCDLAKKTGVGSAEKAVRSERATMKFTSAAVASAKRSPGLTAKPGAALTPDVEPGSDEVEVHDVNAAGELAEAEAESTDAPAENELEAAAEDHCEPMDVEEQKEEAVTAARPMEETEAAAPEAAAELMKVEEVAVAEEEPVAAAQSDEPVVPEPEAVVAEAKTPAAAKLAWEVEEVEQSERALSEALAAASGGLRNRPVTRSASKSLSADRSARRAAKAPTLGAVASLQKTVQGKTPVSGNKKTSAAKTPKSTRSTGRKTSKEATPKYLGETLEAMGHDYASPVATTTETADIVPASVQEAVPLVMNQLYEKASEVEADPATTVEATEVDASVAPTSPAAAPPAPAPAATAVPQPSKLASSVTSFVPMVRKEEKPAAPAAGDRSKVEGKLKALQAAEAAKKAEMQREEERRLRKERMMAARQNNALAASNAVAAGSAPTSTAPSSYRSQAAPTSHPVPSSTAAGSSSTTTATTSAAGSVMERLKRAMELKSRQEAEKAANKKREEEERQRRREQDALERKRAKEAAEAKEREEKRRRQEKLQQARKEQEEAQRAAREEQMRMRRLLDEQERQKREGAVGTALKRKSNGAGLKDVGSAEEKKRRLQDFIASNKANAAGTSVMAPPPSKPYGTSTPTAARIAAPGVSKPGTSAVEYTSYEISPYRSSSDSEEDDEERAPRKPIPGWARTEALVPVLTRQAKVDPDEIFVNPSKTCALDVVFAGHGSGGGRSKERRSSSGNWFHDRLTWKEELTYKRDMGFITK